MGSQDILSKEFEDGLSVISLDFRSLLRVPCPCAGAHQEEHRLPPTEQPRDELAPEQAGPAGDEYRIQS